jgi:hypothetical protein
MGILTPEQRRLVFKCVNNTVARLAKSVANHEEQPKGQNTVELISQLNEIIEIIGPNGEDMVPVLDPKNRAFSSRMIL